MKIKDEGSFILVSTQSHTQYTDSNIYKYIRPTCILSTINYRNGVINDIMLVKNRLRAEFMY